MGVQFLPGVDPSTLIPYSPEMYDSAAWDEMAAFRSPFITLHETTYHLLLIAIVVHVAGVIVTEKREGGALISAMFTGEKVIRGEPVDQDINK